MEDGVSRLIELLSEEEGTLQELLHLLEEERNTLLQHDMAKLENLAERKQRFYDRIEASSRLGRQLIDRLASEVGVAGALTLSPVLKRLPQPERETLQGLQGRLRELGIGLERLSSQNGQLLQGALLTVNRSLAFFGRLLNRSTTYGGAGRMVAAAVSPRLLRREA